jgi:hypothetical protein
MDAEAFADSLHPVCSIAAFDQWARETLPRFVPHAMSMFGFAVRHALGFAIERVVSVNLPPEYLRSISGPAGSLMCPVLYDWFRSREPQIFEVDAPHGEGVDAKWLAKFREFHLQSLGVHGHTSPCGRMVTFVGFYRLPNAQTQGRQALRLVAPAVHEALLRSCAPAPTHAPTVDAPTADASGLPSHPTAGSRTSSASVSSACVVCTGYKPSGNLSAWR